MRLTTSVLAAITVVMFAGTSSALVSASYSSAADGRTDLALGETFTVDVNLTWDGEGALQGVFASTEWDAGVLQLTNLDWFGSGEFATSVFNKFSPPPFVPGLSRLGGANQPGDPAGLTRTIQYGGSAAADAGGAGTELITTMTFQVIGLGASSIGTVIAQGDSGGVGDAFDGGNTLSVAVIPEPGTALLMGLGLAGLAGAGRRN